VATSLRWSPSAPEAITATNPDRRSFFRNKSAQSQIDDELSCPERAAETPNRSEHEDGGREMLAMMPNRGVVTFADARNSGDCLRLTWQI